MNSVVSGKFMTTNAAVSCLGLWVSAKGVGLRLSMPFALCMQLQREPVRAHCKSGRAGDPGMPAICSCA